MFVTSPTPSINWSNPSAKGLVWNVTPNPNTRLELVGRQSPTIVGATLTGLTQLGKAASYSAATGQLLYYTSSPLVTAITRYETIMVWATITSITAAGLVDFFSTARDSVNNNPFQHVFGIFGANNGTAGIYQYQTSSSSGSAITGIGSNNLGVVDGTLHQYTVTRNQATITFYRDGIQFGNTATLSSNLDPYWSSEPHILGNCATSQTLEGMIGTIPFCGVWNRDLKPNEIKSLFVNPWQLYQQPNLPKVYLASTPSVSTGATLLMMGI